MVKLKNLEKTATAPSSKGKVGVVIDSGVEGYKQNSGKDSIGTNSRPQGKKSAGQVGATNMNAA